MFLDVLLGYPMDVFQKLRLNVVFNSLPFWVFLGCVLFFLFFCFAVGVSGDLFLLFLDCLKPTPQ